MADLRRQYFVIARLADFCDFSRLDLDREPDPTFYLWRKLEELEEPMYALKQELLEDAVRGFLRKMVEGGVREAELVEFRQVLDRFVSPGDFADAAFHLDLESLRSLERLKWAEECLRGLRAQRLLDEEGRPQAQRFPVWEKLVGELYQRLDFNRLEMTVSRRPLTTRRLRFILRRCRFNSANYCSVFHLPLYPEDTFTPFILPRVEALVAANRRFLRRLRTYR